jgi:hypothetical protein
MQVQRSQEPTPRLHTSVSVSPNWDRQTLGVRRLAKITMSLRRIKAIGRGRMVGAAGGRRAEGGGRRAGRSSQ